MPGAPRKKTTARRATAAKRPARKPVKKPVKKPAKKPAKPAARSGTKKPARKPAKKAAKPAVRKPAKPATRTPARATTAAPRRTAKAAPVKVAKKPTTTKPAKAAKKAPVTRAPATRPPGPQVTDAALRAKPAPGRKKGTVVCELSGFEVTPSTPALAPKTLERLRTKLVEEKQRLLHQAEELAAEAEQLAAEREAGDTQFDEESGEGDTVNVERERDLLLSASARQVVEEIDEALARMKKGTYGVCKHAGRKLPLERLEAIPWANVCVDCKARAERRR